MSATPGEFYFKLTTEGNLEGHFTNRGTQFICPENATRVSVDRGLGFAGKYSTQWEELDTREIDAAILTIESNVIENGVQYVLEWRSERVLRFRGYGFEAFGILLGHYVADRD